MTLSEKKITGEVPDREVAEVVRARSREGKLPCAVAFDIARETGAPRAVVGACADHLKIKLCKCQLGLFGHGEGEKPEKASDEVAARLEGEIREALGETGTLACERAFAIAEASGLAKRDVSGTCERLGIRIKPCQLGAF